MVNTEKEKKTKTKQKNYFTI